MEQINTLNLIPKLIRASLSLDKKSVEAIALMIARKIRASNPDIAREISKAISYSGYDNSTARSIDMLPLPVDKETRHSLVKVSEPMEVECPILNDSVMSQLNDFIKERQIIQKFLDAGITPPNSLLLNGEPGVGKTYIAHWVAHKLNLPLITLDLASSVSSYLGKSGQNIKSIFEYATSHNAVLLLDELDSIAKRRDDASDLGELKRLVNVLLKELEACPSSCIIIGATNHPELLDKAIWRRFDRALTVSMPGENERRLLLQRHLGQTFDHLSKITIKYLSVNTKNINASDVCKLCEHIKRYNIINPEEDINIISLQELFKISNSLKKESKKLICEHIKNNYSALSQRDISKITQIPLASVSRYLTTQKEDKNGK